VKAGCLPGWLVEDQQGKIEAQAPRRLASFSIQAGNLGNTSLRSWARESLLEGRKPIPSVKVKSGGRVYAERAEDLVSSEPYKAVHVWFFRGRPHGFHAWAKAAPETFSLFERDFIKLFAALGIEGDLFPSLRGGEHTCRS
jgi:hypothetical protein